MRIQSLLEAMADALEAEGIGPVHLRRLSAIDGCEGVVVRPGAARVSVQYIDGSCEVQLPVRVICKRRDAMLAMAEAEDAADALGMRAIDVDGTSVAVDCDADRARELELSDSDWSVWEAGLLCSYTDKPKEATE